MTPSASIVHLPRRRRCGLSSCRQEISAALLFCLPHWRRVPAEIQDRIRRYWRPGLPLAGQFEEYRVALRHALKALRGRRTSS